MSKDQLDAIHIACEQLVDLAGGTRIRVYGFDPMPAEPQPYEDPRSRLSAEAVTCPRCQRPIVPNQDGTLPGHQMSGGPGRSPFCPFRGTPEQVKR